MELSVSSETTFFNMKLQLEICPQLRTGSSAEDTGRIDTRVLDTPYSITDQQTRANNGTDRKWRWRGYTI